MATRWNKRRLIATFVLIGVVSLLYLQHDSGALAPWEVEPGSDIRPPGPPRPPTPPMQQDVWRAPAAVVDDGKFHWTNLKLHNPVTPEAMRLVPSASAEKLRAIPKIQHVFGAETEAAKRVRLERLALVKANFTHAWTGYKTNAWMSDEVRPIKGGGVERFGGWAATLVDSLGMCRCCR